MKKFLLFLVFSCNVAYAQVVGTQPDPNATYTQSQNLLSPTVNAWTGTIAGQNGGFSGGTTPAFNAGTNTIIFGYVMAPATQTIAINSALATAGTGLKIGGYSYSWSVQNDPNAQQYGTLSSTVTLKDTAGTSLQSYVTNYPQMPGAGFINYSGTQWFSQDYSLANVSDLELKFTGKDQTFWAGYYGPQVRNPSLMLQYTQDLCASNPLYDPSCPGYAAAYQTQQCSINPLFSPSCPNYTTAQCSINPLFSQVCPNYQAAYLAQQCSLNPLYDSSCPGYASAYAAAQLEQQCNSDPLYSTSCPNYAEEYAKKNILGISTTTSSTTTTTDTVSKTEATTTVSNDGKVKTEVSKTGDSNVDSVIETKATTASPSDTTASVKLTSPSTGGQSASVQTNTKTETRTETKTTSSTQQQTTTTARTERSEQKSGTNESKSSAEMKQASNEKAKEEMKKAEGAKTFESQIATQAAVVNAISFVPGFDSYQTTKIVDVNALQLQKQYGKDVVDNRRLNRGLFGATDLKHQEMINQQYR